MSFRSSNCSGLSIALGWRKSSGMIEAVVFATTVGPEAAGVGSTEGLSVGTTAPLAALSTAGSIASTTGTSAGLDTTGEDSVATDSNDTLSTPTGLFAVAFAFPASFAAFFAGVGAAGFA
jgi:hypothetical protein